MMAATFLGEVFETQQGTFCLSPADQGVSRELRESGQYGVRELVNLKNFVNRQSSVLLIGAHVGALVVPLSKSVGGIEAIEANPNASGALVNLGTIAFRQRNLKDALAWYQRAAAADPDYPLAHFNLGNLFDERGDVEAARAHYLDAIRLNPRYADAHFNLALLCERNGDLLQAIGYWQTYLKLDGTSSWANTARKQLDRLKKSLRSK